MSKFEKYLEAVQASKYLITVGQAWRKKLIEYVNERDGWKTGRGSLTSGSTAFSLQIEANESAKEIKNELWDNLSDTISIQVKKI